VGDISFQMKCFARITDIRHSGTTVLVVSHNLNAVRQLCDRVLVLHNGVSRFLGSTPEALSEYHKAIDENREPERMGLEEDDPARLGVAEILQFELLGEGDVPTAHLALGRPVVFRIRARFHEAVKNPTFGILLTTAAGDPVYYENSGRTPAGLVGPGDVECRIELAAPLTTGTFMATAALRSTEPPARLSRTEPMSFYVDGRPFVSGVADLGARFEVGAGGGS
jgi:lipopolysaccharide transport system ATP-binding protein